MTPEETLLAYIDASPTPYHAVAEARFRLVAEGFNELRLDEPWSLGPGDKRFVSFDHGSFVAFVVGTDPVAAGFRVVGAHTDSPNLRVKPQPDLDGHGFRRLGLSPYGGLQVATWVDRDLGIAGQASFYGDSGVEHGLFKIDRPVCRIATLAIHLNREVNDKGLLLNKQKELPALFGLETKDDGSFRRFLAAQLGIDKAALISWDASLFDLCPSRLGGEDGEFIFAPRLDNLASCHAGLLALIAAQQTASSAVLVCFDNEEVGSQSARGADSPLLSSTLRRILDGCGHSAPQDFPVSLANSLLVSADMAHAGHPNFADKHDPNHMPQLNKGPVIKSNVNQRYATTSRTLAYFARLCEKLEVPVQQFVNRSDLRCGSTIGPISAGNVGIDTVDVGNPMLSMHSVREMAGSQDHQAMARVLRAHFEGSP